MKGDVIIYHIKQYRGYSRCIEYPGLDFFVDEFFLSRASLCGDHKDFHQLAVL